MAVSNGHSAQNGTGFLSFNAKPPLIWIMGDKEEFDETISRYWKEEGFETKYLHCNPKIDAKVYLDQLKSLHNALPLGTSYAIVAYGTAASLVLRAAAKPMPKLCALVAYYPPVIPNPRAKFPSLLEVMVHMAGTQVVPSTEFRCYEYPNTAPGFAERTKKEYEDVEAGLSWGRTLGCVKRGFKMGIDAAIERVWEKNLDGKFYSETDEDGAIETVNTLVQDRPYVTYGPTLTGGIGVPDLEDFYRDYFNPSIVPDFSIRLVSRTIGVDRIVDEMVASFTHSDEVDWILPDVPPTDKKVEIAMVSIVGFRGGKLTHEHVYWDQASVLLQIGLLDPENVPDDMKADGMARLPVVGAEAARQILNPEKSRYNALLPLE